MQIRAVGFHPAPPSRRTTPSQPATSRPAAPDTYVSAPARLAGTVTPGPVVPPIPGPAGPVVVFLMERRRFLHTRTEEIPRAEAERLLADPKASPRVLVQLDDRPLPLETATDLAEVDYFAGTGGVEALKDPDLAQRLKTFAAQGLQLFSSDRVVSPYEAYNLLTTGWPGAEVGPAPVEVLDSGIPVFSLDNRDRSARPLEENRNRAASAAGHPRELIRYLDDFYHQDPRKTAAAVDRIAGLDETTRQLHRILADRSMPLEQRFEWLERLEGRQEAVPALQALERSGFFAQGYGNPGYYQGATGKAYEALEAQMQAGAPLEKAASRIETAWNILRNHYKYEQGVTAFENLSKLAHSPDQIEFHNQLLTGGFDAEHALQFTELVGEPVGPAALKARHQSFQDLGLLNSEGLRTKYAVKTALWEAFRAEIAGGAQAPTVTKRLDALLEALTNQRADHNQAVQACTYYRESLQGGSEKYQAFLSQLRAGTPVPVARASVERAASTGSVTRGVAFLEGLGQAGQKLDDAVAEAFQESFEQQVSAGRPASQVSSNLARLAKAVGSQRLATGQAVELAAYAAEKLAGRPEQAEVLARILENGLAFPEARQLLERMEPPAGNSSLTERFEALKSLGVFRRDYGCIAYYQSGRDKAYEALEAQLQKGASLPEASSRIQTAWNILRNRYKYEQGVTAFENLTKLAPNPDQIEFHNQLLTSGFDADHALQTTERVGEPVGPGSLSARQQAFKRLELLNGEGLRNHYNVKDALWDAFRGEVQAGEPEHLSERRLLQLVQTMEGSCTDKQAASALRFYASDLQRNPAGFESFLGLLQNGLPEAVAQEAHRLAQAGKQELEIVSALGKSATSQRVHALHTTLQQLPGEAPGLKALAEAASRRPKEDIEPWLEGFRPLAGQPEQQLLYGRLMGQPLGLDQRQDLFRAIRASSPEKEYQARVDALEELRVFQSGYSDPGYDKRAAELFYAALDAGIGGGASIQSTTQALKSLWQALDGAYKRERAGAAFLEEIAKDPATAVDRTRVFTELGPSQWPAAKSIDFAWNGGPQGLKIFLKLGEQGFSLNVRARALGRAQVGAGGTTREGRLEALERLANLVTKARPGWGRSLYLGLKRFVTKEEALDASILEPLYETYHDTVKKGYPSALALEKLEGYYQNRARAGDSHKQVVEGLKQFAEMAELEASLLPDHEGTIEGDDEKVVINGVTLKKRRRP